MLVCPVLDGFTGLLGCLASSGLSGSFGFYQRLYSFPHAKNKSGIIVIFWMLFAFLFALLRNSRLKNSNLGLCKKNLTGVGLQSQSPEWSVQGQSQ